MLNLIRLSLLQGRQFIKKPKKAKVPGPFKGFPLLTPGTSKKWAACGELCPTGAILEAPPRLDLGKCIFCGACERTFPDQVNFTPEHRLGADKRQLLEIHAGQGFNAFALEAVKVRREIHGLFGRSLKLRSVSAGGCGACEMELNACGNVNFDMGRYGIEITASPRHADGLVLTGPISRNMSQSLWETYASMPRPKVFIAMGACAISGGIFQGSDALDRSGLDRITPDLYLPGCPVHPLTFVNGVLDLLRRK